MLSFFVQAILLIPRPTQCRISFFSAWTVHWTLSLINIVDLVVGNPIKTSDERAEQIGPAQGIPIFGLDGLSSAAYGPEAALSLLAPLGLLGVRYIVPSARPSSRYSESCTFRIAKPSPLIP